MNAIGSCARNSKTIITALRNVPKQKHRITWRCNSHWIRPRNNGLVYTGRWKIKPTAEFYESLRPQSFVAPDRFEKFTFFVGGECSSLDYESNDIVEIRTRDGGVDLGIVKDSSGQYIAVETVSGETKEIPSSLVGFVLRGLDLEIDGLVAFMQRAFIENTKMAPYWQAAHAQCVKANVMTGVHPAFIARQAYRASRYTGELSAEHVVAAYIAMSNSDMFARTDLLSEFFIPSMLKATLSVEPSQNARRYLELYLLTHPISEEHNAESALAALSPQTDSIRESCSSSTIVSALGNQSHHPLLLKGGLAWETKNSLSDDFETPFVRRLKQLNSKTWDNMPRRRIIDNVFVFKGYEDIGLSLQRLKRDLWRLSIHVIDVGYTSQSRPIVDFITDRARTLQAGAMQRRVFPDSFVEARSFGKSEKSNTLTFSVDVEPWNPLNWKPENVSIEHTRVYNPTCLEPDQCELEMRWKYRQVGELLYTEEGGSMSPEIEISRQDRNILSSIRDILDKFHWGRMSKGAAVDRLPDRSAAYEASSGEVITRMIQEARVAAGQICASYCHNKGLTVPYVTQDLRHASHDELQDIRELSELASQGSKAASLIVKHNRLAAEKVIPKKGPHYGLGALEGYTHVAYPFDDALSVYTQWILRRELAKHREDISSTEAAAIGSVRLDSRSLMSVEDFALEVEPHGRLISQFSDRIMRYDALCQLQARLRSSDPGFFIFRCTVVRGAKFPDLALAYCEELALTVEVALAPNTFLEPGDRIVCNVILELSPIDGLLVFSL